MKQKIYYCPLLKIVKSWLNKLIENLKRLWNSKWLNQEKFFISTQVKENWMLGLIDLEVYNSIFNITKENNKFELHTDTFDEISFEELKNDVEEILNIPEITDDHLEDDILAPRIAETYRKLRSDKSRHDGFIILLMGYARSLFRDFESYLRIVVGLEEDNIRLIL